MKFVDLSTIYPEDDLDITGRNSNLFKLNLIKCEICLKLND